MISVTICAYNVEQYLRKAVNSVLHQTEQDFELLIIDDGSTDNTLEIMQSFTDPRIKLYRNVKNIGVWRSKNILLSKCKGQYITGLGADDWIDRRLFKEQLKAFDKNTIAVRCLYARFDKRGKKLWRNLPAWAGIMMKRQIFDELGYFDNVKFGADAEYLDRMIYKYGEKAVKTIHKLYYFALMRPDNITSTQREGTPLRNEYGSAYTQWHGTANNLYMKPNERPFKVNKKML